MNILLALSTFILVHGPGQLEVSVNTGEISSIRQVLHGKDEQSGLHHKDIKCLIVMTNGKFIGTTETCLDVIQLIANMGKTP